MSFRAQMRGRASRVSARGAAPRLRASRLDVEALEDRLTPAAVLAVGDVVILEGHAGVQDALVAVTLSEPHGNKVTVNYTTADGTAKAGSDYASVSGKLTFVRGQNTLSILVPVKGNRVVDADEDFFVRLANAKGAKIADGEGIVTIVDDEPRISISDVWQGEGNSGSTPFTFVVGLSAPYDLPVTVSYATADGSASAGADYMSASGTWTFGPDETSHAITVEVNGDRLPEPDKTLFVNVSSPDSYAQVSKGMGVGTIMDDEPRIYISDAWNYGETTFTFTVSLSAAYDQDVTVNFATLDGTALSGIEYVAAFGSLTFDHTLGETTKTVTVEVLDTAAWDKYFYVQLSGASDNALIANELATGYWYYYDYGYYAGGYYDYGYYYYDYGYCYYDYGYCY